MSHLTPISFVGAASAFPARVVGNDFFGDRESASSPMFRGARHRHHVAPGQTAVSLISEACATLEARLGRSVTDGVDIILTNVSIPDMPFTGCGAEVARELGIPAIVGATDATRTLTNGQLIEIDGSTGTIAPL